MASAKLLWVLEVVTAATFLVVLLASIVSTVYRLQLGMVDPETAIIVLPLALALLIFSPSMLYDYLRRKYRQL